MILSLADFFILLRDIAYYLSKRKRATYAIKTLFFSYIICTAILILYILLTKNTCYETGILKFILFPGVCAFLITIIVISFKFSVPISRLKKINSLREKQNNSK